MDRVSILATGLGLVGGEIRSVEGVLDELLGSASRSIQLAAYRFDPSFIPALHRIRLKGERDVHVNIIVNSIQAQHRSVRNALLAMRETCTVVDFEEMRRDEHELLHAKVLVVDGERAIVGSANFTLGGLTSNAELGVLLEGAGAWTLSRALARLVQGAR